MAIFAIIKQPGLYGEKLGAAIGQRYPDAFYSLSNDAWLVSDIGTAQDVSERLGITSGENGSAVVIEMASYFGRANPAIWSWIKTMWESPPGG